MSPRRRPLAVPGWWKYRISPRWTGNRKMVATTGVRRKITALDRDWIEQGKTLLFAPGHNFELACWLPLLLSYPSRE